MRDANGIPIGRHHGNPMLDTRVYDIEYLDGHKESLAANTIAEYLFSQVDEEGNIFVIFDDIVYHRVGGTYIIHKGAFIISNNGGKKRRETNKG